VRTTLGPENEEVTEAGENCISGSIIQGAAERTPRFGSGVATSGVGVEQWECVIRQMCSCCSQFTPWVG
jgi:hypothetical protein